MPRPDIEPPHRQVPEFLSTQRDPRLPIGRDRWKDVSYIIGAGAAGGSFLVFLGGDIKDFIVGSSIGVLISGVFYIGRSVLSKP